MASKIPRLTATEAAIVTRIPLKRLNRLIDEGALPRGAAGFDATKGRRYVARQALVAIRVVHDMSALLSPEGRRRIAHALVQRTPGRAANDNAADVIAGSAARAARRVVADGLRELERARRLVVVDPDVMGGAPCIKGTRIPAWMVAAMLGNEGLAAVRETWPHLTEVQIEASRDYMALNPKRGRPALSRRRRVTTVYRQSNDGWQRTPD
jgi:uncharacterized protein (DUF433 family)